MVFPKKKNVHRTVCRIDRETKAVTAGVNFEDIDLTIEGEGSEVYDYEYHFVLHSQSSETAVTFELNNSTSYSRDFMQGRNTTASAFSGTSAFVGIAQSSQSSYPSFNNGKITGLIGNKRHVDEIASFSKIASTNIIKESYYTSDTSTELTSIQFQSTSTATITYTLVITAVPKIQYNPHAILLKNLTLTNQTADIIFGGVNDTEGVEIDGELYDIVVKSSGLDSTIDGYINELVVADKTMQHMYNINGTLYSANIPETEDFQIYPDSETCINAEVGRKNISTSTLNEQVAAQQVERYTTNPDTSTPMTSLLLRPSASVSGNIQLYAVPKGYNADLTPWTYRQVVDIAGDFSAGHSFEIPSDALFCKVDFVGEGADSYCFMGITFNNLTQTVDRQYLASSTSSTTSAIQLGVNIFGYIRKVCDFSSLISLKNGSNRVCLSKYNANENSIGLNGLWIKDSSSIFETAQIKASNSNTITGKLVCSFY